MPSETYNLLEEGREEGERIYLKNEKSLINERTKSGGKNKGSRKKLVSWIIGITVAVGILIILGVYFF